MVVCGRGKLGYLTCDAAKPLITNSKYELWRTENALVMSWLKNSMNEYISSSYMSFQTAKDIWDDCKVMYSDVENTLQKFETSTQLKEFKLKNLTVTKYYADLKKIWQELDLYDEPDPFYTDCNMMYKKKIKKDSVYEFLTGLTNDFDEVKGRIINRTPFPRTEDAFSKVRREKTRRKVMMQKGEINNIEKSTLMVKPQNMEDATMTLVANRNRFTNDPRGGRRSERPWCDHCKINGHTKEGCWEIHGKPNNWTPRRQSDSGNVVVTHQGESQHLSFSKEQQEQIHTLLHTSPSPSTITGGTSCSVAKTGNITYIFTPWIIDSGGENTIEAKKWWGLYVPVNSIIYQNFENVNKPNDVTYKTIDPKINSEKTENERLNIPNLHVYTRRNDTISEQNPEPDNPISKPPKNDLHIPIALRKLELDIHLKDL
ncbi:hypothetical protein LIER_05844 [Lithospermum erythrorhizon]|uniref:Retrotransposon gag domain-containing protein n=1 Tax=Lithospermum erythrorhizon TaxID=34254 RepID=A0AAV3P287_LITER